jgi:hypothetical protein
LSRDIEALANVHAAAMRRRILNRNNSGFVFSPAPPQVGILWQPDYEALTDPLAIQQGSRPTATGWDGEQDPDVRGIRRDESIQRVMPGDPLWPTAGDGETYTPSSALRFEALPTLSGAEYLVTVTSGPHPQASTKASVQQTWTFAAGHNLATNDWIRSSAGEMIRILAISVNTATVLRRCSTVPGSQVSPGDSFTVLCGAINDSFENYPTSRAEVMGRRAATGSAAPSSWPDPENSVRWYRLRYLFPTDWANDPDLWGVTCLQIKQQYGGSPPISLEAEDGNTLSVAGVKTTRTTIGSLNKGNWMQVLMGIKFSTSSTVGWLHIEVNGSVIINQRSQATMDTLSGGADPSYLKQGLYRNFAHTITHVVYASAPVVAYDRDSALNAPV